jgi:hypothetical protein
LESDWLPRRPKFCTMAHRNTTLHMMNRPHQQWWLVGDWSKMVKSIQGEQVKSLVLQSAHQCAIGASNRFHETVVMILASSLTIIDIFMIQPLFSLVNH